MHKRGCCLGCIVTSLSRALSDPSRLSAALWWTARVSVSSQGRSTYGHVTSANTAGWLTVRQPPFWISPRSGYEIEYLTWTTMLHLDLFSLITSFHYLPLLIFSFPLSIIFTFSVLFQSPSLYYYLPLASCLVNLSLSLRLSLSLSLPPNVLCTSLYKRVGCGL